jgi:hypothetical protein
MTYIEKDDKVTHTDLFNPLLLSFPHSSIEKVKNEMEKNIQHI